MINVDVKIKKLPHFDEALGLPFYGSDEACGADVKACLEEDLEIKPFERVLIPTGLSFEIPEGYEIQVRPRSGLSFKTGLMVANSPGTVDSDYRGEVKVILCNLSDKLEKVSHGERIAQLVIAPVYRMKLSVVNDISETRRGEGGFGSTGIKELN